MGGRILVAEDNTINLLVVTKMLEQLGCAVEAAANGLIALDKLRSSSFDLILMDCQMPEMDGYEAARIIRSEPGYPNSIPIIALTANVLREDDDRWLLAGMNAHMAKPLKPDALQRILGQWLPPL